MSGKKVLVTGGFGNLGSYIAKHLINSNYEVTILTRKKKNRFKNLKYKVIECDIKNLKELKLKLDYKFDFCVHCAGYDQLSAKNYPKKAIEINTLGTRNLIEALNLNYLKNFIYFSTFHVYGSNKGIINENTNVNPKNDYASTHLFAEYYVSQMGHTNGLKYTILRLTNSYGAPTFKDTDKWDLVINNLAKMAFEKKKITLNTNGKIKRDFIGMNDVAKITQKILKINATNDKYNLSSNKTLKVIELANIVKNIYEKRYNRKIKISINDSSKKKENPNFYVQNKKLKRLIKFKLNDHLEVEINKIFNQLESYE